MKGLSWPLYASWRSLIKQTIYGGIDSRLFAATARLDMDLSEHAWSGPVCGSMNIFPSAGNAENNIALFLSKSGELSATGKEIKEWLWLTSRGLNIFENALKESAVYLVGWKHVKISILSSTQDRVHFGKVRLTLAGRSCNRKSIILTISTE